MLEFEARKYTTDSVDGRSVKIGIENGLLHVKAQNEPPEYVPLADLDLRLGGQNGKRVILASKSSGESFYTESLQVLKELEDSPTKLTDPLAQQLAEARKKLREAPLHEGKWWVITVGLVFLIAGSIFAGVDFAVSIAEKHIPPSVEQQVGAISIESEKKANKLRQTGADYERVKRIGDRLLQEYKDNPYKFSFFIQPSEEVNAFALPGANIIVNSRLVKDVSSDDELAGVLAHEIGHVQKRHSLRSSLRNAGVWVCISLITGRPSKDQVDLIATMINLEDLKYTRAQETEADDISVELTSAAKYRPDAILSLLMRLKKENVLADQRALTMVSTHPMPSERIEHIKELIMAKAKKRRL